MARPKHHALPPRERAAVLAKLEKDMDAIDGAINERPEVFIAISHLLSEGDLAMNLMSAPPDVERLICRLAQMGIAMTISRDVRD